MIHPVILCGGPGNWLWPIFRRAYPKKFAAFSGSRSPFQNTLARLNVPGSDAFLAVIQTGIEATQNGALVAFGVLSTQVETGDT